MTASNDVCDVNISLYVEDKEYFSPLKTENQKSSPSFTKLLSNEFYQNYPATKITSPYPNLDKGIKQIAPHYKEISNTGGVITNIDISIEK